VAVLAAAPTPDQGHRLSHARIAALLRKSGWQRNVTTTAAEIRASLACTFDLDDGRQATWWGALEQRR
jgi:hypothetical protein